VIWVVYLCWSAFLVVWLGGYLYNLIRAPRAVRARGDLGSGGWLERVVVAVVVIVALSRRELGLGALLLTTADSALLSGVGAAVLLVATAFTLWARVSLGTMWSSTPTIKAGHELRTDGPYAITRHPIYTGMLLMFLGTTLLTGSPVALVGSIVFVAYVAVKIRTEEELLLETFGDEYRRFQHTVPAVIPFWVRRSSRGATPH
jgi:protein-S-isoprenylcysteine O-methyltransferase Ste14